MAGGSRVANQGSLRPTPYAAANGPMRTFVYDRFMAELGPTSTTPCRARRPRPQLKSRRARASCRAPLSRDIVRVYARSMRPLEEFFAAFDAWRSAVVAHSARVEWVTATGSRAFAQLMEELEEIERQFVDFEIKAGSVLGPLAFPSPPRFPADERLGPQAAVGQDAAQ